VSAGAPGKAQKEAQRESKREAKDPPNASAATQPHSADCACKAFLKGVAFDKPTFASRNDERSFRLPDPAQVRLEV